MFNSYRVLFARHSPFGHATPTGSTGSLRRATCSGATVGPRWPGEPAVRQGGDDEATL